MFAVFTGLSVISLGVCTDSSPPGKERQKTRDRAAGAGEGRYANVCIERSADSAHWELSSSERGSKRVWKTVADGREDEVGANATVPRAAGGELDRAPRGEAEAALPPGVCVSLEAAFDAVERGPDGCCEQWVPSRPRAYVPDPQRSCRVSSSRRDVLFR